MNYVESLNLFGVEAKEIPCIKGSGAPNDSTVGEVGLLYMNTDNGDMYKCTFISNGVYTWDTVGGAGSGMPTVTEEDNDKSLLVQNGQWSIVPSMELRSYKLMDSATVLEPAKYYVFGEVSSLDITLGESDNELVSEYCFEFIAKDDFSTLTITPEPRWATPIQFVKGKTHQVSILRGIGVMIRA